jgi:hypothetical protein
VNRWRVGPALVAKWPADKAPQCPAGDGPVLPGQTFQIDYDGSPGGATWHDDCAEKAGAYKAR